MEEVKAAVREMFGREVGIGKVKKVLVEGGFHELASAAAVQNESRRRCAHLVPRLAAQIRTALAKCDCNLAGASSAEAVQDEPFVAIWERLPENTMIASGEESGGVGGSSADMVLDANGGCLVASAPDVLQDKTGGGLQVIQHVLVDVEVQTDEELISLEQVTAMVDSQNDKIMDMAQARIEALSLEYESSSKAMKEMFQGKLDENHEKHNKQLDFCNARLELLMNERKLEKSKLTESIRTVRLGDVETVDVTRMVESECASEHSKSASCSFN